MSLYIIMMGVQGAGKGVQASILSESYGIPHVSTGDIFRAMKTREDDLAKEVQATMARGDLISDELTNRIVKDRLDQEDAQVGVILDGYPRNHAQCDWLDNYLAGKGTAVTGVLFLEIDLYVAFKRAYGRVTGADTKKSYNVFFNADALAEWAFENHPEKAYPPRLVGKAKNGEALVRRPDDANAHAVLTRIDTYLDSTMPIIDRYDNQGKVMRVNAEQSIDKVTEDIRAAIAAKQG